MEYYNTCGVRDVELVPVSFDRSVCGETLSPSERVVHGVRDLRRPVRQAVKMMKSERPDVVHVCSSAGLGLMRDYMLVRAARKLGIGSVVHLHFGRIPSLARRKNWEWRLLSKVLGRCDVPVVLNNGSEQTLVTCGFDGADQLPNPIGLGALRTVRDVVANNDLVRVPRRILFCGHVVKPKGAVELVEACARIPDVELRFVGKYLPSFRDELKDKARRMTGDDGWMTFVGEVEHDEVMRAFFAADIFVLPSYTEGFPNVVLEAMACGCPIVATDVGAIREMLDMDGDPCGVCVEPQNVDELHDAILSLLNDEIKKEALARRARQRVNDMYAMPRVWERLVDIWTKAAQKTPSVPLKGG